MRAHVARHSRARRGETVHGPRPAWTGRLEMDLTNGRGWRLQTMEVVVRLDSVALWVNEEQIAIFDRDALRECLGRSVIDLSVDDVILRRRHPDTGLTVDGEMTFLLHRDQVLALRAVV